MMAGMELIIDPGTAAERKVLFSMGPDDVEKAIASGAANRNDPADKLIFDAAWFKTIELGLTSQLLERDWKMIFRGRRVGGTC
jgi:hypothetical protein